MKIQESAENYLETILILNKRMENVKSIDIVHELGFTKASVSVAMKNLRINGYITVDNSGFIKLTPQGTVIAEKIYERHTLLTKFFIQIGVDEKIASEDACRIEHVISEESFQAFKKFTSDLNYNKIVK
ncbi:metal-dependent transcriptional regulator [uncultured Clostridium sp.]|uniref:metal-dependent transcriptional regulator n=1 Tax=uncultured Clostridium sp. TaxID=59620 RepID=UPI0025F1F7F9|nr:metal-dependent transcriptional regulator [uncultured Clostridium sp.]